MRSPAETAEPARPAPARSRGRATASARWWPSPATSTRTGTRTSSSALHSRTTRARTRGGSTCSTGPPISPSRRRWMPACPRSPRWPFTMGRRPVWSPSWRWCCRSALADRERLLRRRRARLRRRAGRGPFGGRRARAAREPPDLARPPGLPREPRPVGLAAQFAGQPAEAPRPGRADHRRDEHLLPPPLRSPRAPAIHQHARASQRGDQAAHPRRPHLPLRRELSTTGPSARRRTARGAAGRQCVPRYACPPGGASPAAAPGGCLVLLATSPRNPFGPAT